MSVVSVTNIRYGMGEKCISPRTARRKDSPKLNTPPPSPVPFTFVFERYPIRPERQRRKVRRWEDSKIYPSKLYEGPTIPLLGQGLVLTKRPGMDAPPCEERGFPALPCETPLRQGPQKTVKTVGRWLGKIKESHDKTIWQHWTMIMVIILTHLLLYTSKLLKYTCWVYNVLGSRWTCVPYFAKFCDWISFLYIYIGPHISL